MPSAASVRTTPKTAPKPAPAEPPSKPPFGSVESIRLHTDELKSDIALLKVVQAVTATTRRAALGALIAVPALALPAVAAVEAVGPAGVPDPALSALIMQWHETNRVLIETHDASCAADDRAKCPVLQALIATENDANHWFRAVAGKPFQKHDVDQLRNWMALPNRPKGPIPRQVVPDSEFDTRANEIISAWDQWQAEQKAAKEREGVAEASERWGRALGSYNAMGRRIAKTPSKTMADVIAKLLAAAVHMTKDDLDDDAHIAVAAGAAFDAGALTSAA
jgi:hypothetical protein